MLGEQRAVVKPKVKRILRIVKKQSCEEAEERKLSEKLGVYFPCTTVHLGDKFSHFCRLGWIIHGKCIKLNYSISSILLMDNLFRFRRWKLYSYFYVEKHTLISLPVHLFYYNFFTLRSPVLWNQVKITNS